MPPPAREIDADQAEYEARGVPPVPTRQPLRGTRRKVKGGSGRRNSEWSLLKPPSLVSCGAL